MDGGEGTDTVSEIHKKTVISMQAARTNHIMRIIFINNYYYDRGGAERIFLDEISLLNSRGHCCAPFTRHHEKNYPSEYSSFFAPEFQHKNIPFVSKGPAFFKFIYSFDTKKSFSKLISEFKPDIIHAHNIYGRITSSVIDIAKEKRIPVVMTLNDYKLICPECTMLCQGEVCSKCNGSHFIHCILNRCRNNDLPTSAAYAIESYIINKLKKLEWVSQFICPSHFIFNQHKEINGVKGKLLHIPHFVNASHYSPLYSPGKYILYAGRLSREKGIFTLLKAIDQLQTTLRIAGDGPLLKDIQSYITDHNINNVILEGHKSDAELRDLITNSAFIIVPSECCEAFGLAVLEAFACGKPVIGSDIGGLPELIKDHVTGLLFTPGDHQELKEKIIYLLQNPALNTKMGEAARKKTETDYSPNLHYERLLKLYSSLLS